MIVIGDVHGRFDLIMELVDLLPKNSNLCFVGDLIDRGPDSKQVVDLVKDNNYQCVRGNHEDMLIRGFSDWTSVNLWYQNGGGITVDSFGGKDNCLKDYLPWLKSLPLYIIYKNFLISHSYAYDSINTYEDDLLWGRDLLSDPLNNEYINIFGHTPHKKVTQYGNNWCIDTGAFHTGVLSAIDLDDNMKLYQTKGKVNATV